MRPTHPLAHTAVDCELPVSFTRARWNANGQLAVCVCQSYSESHSGMVARTDLAPSQRVHLCVVNAASVSTTTVRCPGPGAK